MAAIVLAVLCAKNAQNAKIAQHKMQKLHFGNSENHVKENGFCDCHQF